MWRVRAPLDCLLGVAVHAEDQAELLSGPQVKRLDPGLLSSLKLVRVVIGIVCLRLPAQDVILFALHQAARLH